MSPESSEPEKHENPRPGRLAALLAVPGNLLDWGRANRLKAGLGAGACVLAAAAAVTFWVVASGPEDAEEVTLELAMDALDRGEYREARRMAEKLRDGRLSPDDPLGAPSFLLGAAAAYEADEAWRADRESLHLLAARYLEEARDLGFPPGREGEGLYLLGRSRYRIGEMAAARLVLREALKANPRQATEIHRLLAAAYLEDANPKLAEALEENAICLADDTLPDERRDEVLLQRAEILLRLGKAEACLEVIDRVAEDSARHVEAIVIRGRVLMHQAQSLAEGASGEEAEKSAASADGAGPAEAAGQTPDAASEKYRAAIQTFRLAQGRDTLSLQASRKAMYLIGVCYLELGDLRAALSQFERVRRKYVKTPEALAAGFQIAELARRLGHDQEALAAYRETLASVGDVKQYSNPWLSLDDLRAGLLFAQKYYRDTENFATCLQLTRYFPPVFTRARTVELVAETHQLWGQHLLDEAAELPGARAESVARQGRAQLRRAGRTFERLAKYRLTTRHYSDDLWDSAQCYLEGHGYASAVEVLREFLKSRPRRRNPQALVDLGEALLAVGEIDEAISVLEECLAFHQRDAAYFRARLAASRAYQESGDLDKAEALLVENLEGEFLTPDSREWRESLFRLGEMLHLVGRHEEAIPRLEMAVARYPDRPEAIGARYLVADCYRRRAKLTESKLAEDLIESMRRDLSQQISEALRAALDRYQQARDALTQREKTTELCPAERRLLRNCYFAIGSTLFDLGQRDQAIEAYTLATGRYPNEPETVEAYVQIARAHRRLGKSDQVRRTISQAKAVLDRLGSQADFQRTTIHAHDEWLEVLESLAKL